eukprot:TRINITY_DN2480_c0_g1_i1.p1 TRINITY_DN2480_c0_g1~~TRINITY_DN2480_c0_g1_i1.p1  ORF type:complete len:442 (-),score=125.20 TRINITY_DN2480_c0_g1_i1:145-1338(-)
MGVHSSKNLSKKELDALQQQTKYSEDELRKLWRECEGHKNHSQLKRATILSTLRKAYRIKHKDPGDDELTTRICSLLDSDGNGSIDFQEFVVGMSVLIKGTERTKLEFLFRLYDADSNGVITTSEFSQMIKIVASSRLAQSILRIRLDLNKTTIDKWIEKEFKATDVNQDGVITLSEYMNRVTQVIEEAPSIKEETAEEPSDDSFALGDLNKSNDSFGNLKQGFKVIVAGPKSSQKDRIAEAIASTLGVPHISTMGIMQEEAESKTCLGLKCKHYLDRGTDVPDDVVASILENKLDSLGADWVLDGFPFTEGQVLYMNQAGWVPDQIILLCLPKSQNEEDSEEAVKKHNKFEACLTRMYGDTIHKVDASEPFGDVVHKSIMLLEPLQKNQRVRKESV